MADKIEISLDELQELLCYRKEFNAVCDLFNIPPSIRHYPNTAKNIIERIKTYQTGYLLRKSAADKENQLAFDELPEPQLQDPS